MKQLQRSFRELLRYPSAIVSIVMLMVSGRSHQGHCRILRYIRLMTTDGREVVLWSVSRALCRWWRLVAGGRSSSLWRHSATITFLSCISLRAHSAAHRAAAHASISQCHRRATTVPPQRHNHATAALPLHAAARRIRAPAACWEL